MDNYQGVDYVLFNANNQQDQMFQQGQFQQQQGFQQQGYEAYQPQMGYQQQFGGFDMTTAQVIQARSTNIILDDVLFTNIVSLQRRTYAAAIFLIVLQLLTTIYMPQGLYCLQGIIFGILAIIAAAKANVSLVGLTILAGVLGIGPLLYIEIYYSQIYQSYIHYCINEFSFECYYNGWHVFLYFQLWFALVLQIIVLSHLGALQKNLKEWKETYNQEYPEK